MGIDKTEHVWYINSEISKTNKKSEGLMSKCEFKMEIEVNGKKSVLVMGKNNLTSYLKSKENENGMCL